MGADSRALSGGKCSGQSSRSQTNPCAASFGSGPVDSQHRRSVGGKTKRGKGVKTMAIVDRHGLPLAVSTHAANHHEVTLVQLSFDFYMIEAKPENLIGDRAYDSDQLDAQLREEGVEMIAPTAKERRLRMDDDCAAMNGAGSWSASLRGFSGNVASWFAGSTTPRTSWALSSSRPSSFC
jgi:hypothetical protein